MPCGLPARKAMRAFAGWVEMTARADFAVKQGTTVPLTFAILDGKGEPHPSLKHLDSAVLTIVPTAAEAVTLPLSIKPGGIGTVLTAEQTREWRWRWARYSVRVTVKGVAAVIYEGNLTFETELGA